MLRFTRISYGIVPAAAGTIPYEILVNLNTRIPRDYVGGAGNPRGDAV